MRHIEIIRSLAPELADSRPRALRAARLPHLTTLIHFADTDELGFYDFAAIEELSDHRRARLDELSGLIQPNDPANIQLASGTTGLPKAVTLTCRRLPNTAIFLGPYRALSRVTACV